MRSTACGLALLLAVPAYAENAADRVVAAFHAKDAAALKALAAKDKPDPWSVAGQLCARGEHDAAKAFAEAAPRPDVARLPAFVEARRGAPGDPAVEKALARAREAGSPAEWERALARLAELRGAKDLFDRARVEVQRGNTLAKLRRYKESAEAFAEGGDVAEQLGWLALAARAFHSGGLQAHKRQDFGAMRYAFERLRTVEQARANRRGAARAVLLMGALHAELGDYDRALELLREAEKEYLAISDADGAAWVMNNLGTVYARKGEYRKAQAAYERGIQFAEQVDHTYRIAALTNDLAVIYQNLSDFDRAFVTHQQALALWKSLEDLDGVAESTGNLGIVYMERKMYEEALAHLHEALEMFRAQDDERYICIALMNIGWVYKEKGDLEKALDFSERALEMAQDLGLPWDEANGMQNLAAIHFTMGNYPAARRLNGQAMQLAERLASSKLRMDGHLLTARLWLGEKNYARAAYASGRAIDEFAKLTMGLAEEQAAIARSRKVELYEVATRAAAAWGKPAALFTFLESGRAGALLESLEGREAIRAASIPAGLRKLEGQTRNAATRALRRFQEAVKGGERLEIRKRRAELDRARLAVEEVVRRVQREAKAGAHTLYPEAAPLEDVQAELAADEALVIYALLPEDSLALVVSRAEARIVPLGEQAAIEAASDLRLGDVATDPAGRIAALRRLVIEPLGLKDETRHLLISPDDVLGYVPFQTLCGKRRVSYIPSGTTYGILRPMRGRKGDQVLALGDPDYGTLPRAENLTVRRGGFDPLPATREEAKRVGDVVLLGEKATRAGLTRALAGRKRWRAVHLACHGFVDQDRPMLSALQLTAAGDDGGSLTCGDVFGMSIPTDLVVLSACETAKGKVYRAEGIVGLTRAFMLAGAPRVIVSLWKVDDEATRALMVKFYELWKTQPTAAALRNAQAWVASHDKWRHPYFWAAWQLWGLSD